MTNTRSLLLAAFLALVLAPLAANADTPLEEQRKGFAELEYTWIPVDEVLYNASAIQAIDGRSPVIFHIGNQEVTFSIKIVEGAPTLHRNGFPMEGAIYVRKIFALGNRLLAWYPQMPDGGLVSYDPTFLNSEPVAVWNYLGNGPATDGPAAPTWLSDVTVFNGQTMALNKAESGFRFLNLGETLYVVGPSADTRQMSLFEFVEPGQPLQLIRILEEGAEPDTREASIPAFQAMGENEKAMP